MFRPIQNACKLYEDQRDPCKMVKIGAENIQMFIFNSCCDSWLSIQKILVSSLFTNVVLILNILAAHYITFQGMYQLLIVEKQKISYQIYKQISI